MNNFLKHSFDEIYIFDGETLKFIQASTGALTNLGYSLDEMREMTPIHLKPEFTKKRFEDLIKPLRTGEKPQLVFKTRHQRKDGSDYPVEVRLQFTSNEAEAVFFASILDLTEFKQAEETLRSSEEKLRKMFEFSPLGIILNSMDGQFIEANPAMLKMVGYTLEEMNALSYWDLTPSKYEEDEARQLESLAKTGRYGPYEKEYIRKDGSRVPINLNGVLITGSDGTQYIWSTIEDITERKQAEEALRLAQFTLDHAPDGVFWMQEDGSVSYVNHEGCRSLGYSRDELIGMHVWDFDPDFPAEIWPQQWEKMRHERPKPFETRHRGKDGKIHPVEISVVRTNYGELEHHSAFVRDITERKRAEEALRCLNEELEDRVEQRTATVRLQAQIIDQTHDSVITTDLEGIVDSWNGGAERLFGISADDAIGQPISFIYPRQEHAFLQNEVIAPLIKNGQHETDVRMKRGDGTEFPAHLSLSLLYDETGMPRGMVGYSIDISEQKKREKKLDDLARRLQASNKELESFSYSVSHDLRAPLRAIDGFSLALVEDYGNQLDDTAHDYLRRVRNGAQRMGMLIDDMLQLSRVNRRELVIEEIDLGAIARSVMDELQSVEPERQVELILDQDLHVQGDPRLLRVVMDNLLGNAWKFTSQEPKAKINFKRRVDDPTALVISDNGVGFDMRHMDKLFGAFQRLHSTREFPGTGVGLATVQRIIHRHGGRIWAEANEGEGATFYFTLGPQGEAHKNITTVKRGT